MNKTPSTSKLQGAEKKKVRWCTNEKKRKKKKKKSFTPERLEYDYKNYKM